MTGKSHISIAAFVSAGEREAVCLATDHLARALSQATAVPWTCNCVFSPNMETLRQGNDAAMIITSLLPELGVIEESWPQAEGRLRTAYAELCECGVPVFVCTILRHVGCDGEPECAAAQRIRIRRLNLLAAEISRETGAFVIDLDRVLADIGARRLQTDYRLAGNSAVDMAAYFIALTLVDNALDAFVSFEVQDGTKEILTRTRSAFNSASSTKTEITFGKNLLIMGQGRRKQIISPVLHPFQEKQAGWVIRQVLRGRIGPADAFDKLVRAVRQRGVRESAYLIASGLFRQIDHK